MNNIKSIFVLITTIPRALQPQLDNNLPIV